VLLLFAAKATVHCALQSVAVVCSESNTIHQMCCCLQPKQLVTVHYKVLLLFTAKATLYIKCVAVCSQRKWTLCITKCCCCLQPNQLVTVHYKVLLLFAAKAIGHCALQSVAVVCSQSK
jgi:hypothetical protein